MTKILVIGDSCTDIYTYCKSSRLAPDKPVPILEVEEVRSCPGMAYNVFCNAASLCGEEVDMATNDNYKDVTKNRYVDKASNHMFFRLDSSVPIERIDGVEDLSFDYETIVISDYDKGFLTEEDIEQICENHHRVFLDTKKILGPWARAAKFIKINNHEYQRSHEFIDKYLKDKVIRTMGDEGCTYKDKVYSTKRIETIDLSGAGDTFLAALAVHYTHKEDISKAIKFANKCASQVCRKKGTSIVVKD